MTTTSVKTEQKQQKPGRTLVVVGYVLSGESEGGLSAHGSVLQDVLHRQGTHRQGYVSSPRLGDSQLTARIAIAQALQTKVFCDSRKAAILRCQADPELHALLTKDPLEGGVHLVPLGVIASDRLKEYVERFKGHYSKAVGFRPTGWTCVALLTPLQTKTFQLTHAVRFSAPAGSDLQPSVSAVIARAQSRTFTHAQLSPMKNASAALQVYGVPYSEHSSFFELTCFALSLDWGRMIATVNVGSEKSRKKMSVWIERWEVERKRRNGEPVPHRAEDYW